MSSYPSSTCATNGSVKSSSPHSGSSSPNTSSSSSSAEHAVRVDAFVNNRIDANAQYQYTSSQASIAAHSAKMKTYLDTFDSVMEGKK